MILSTFLLLTHQYPIMMRMTMTNSQWPHQMLLRSSWLIGAQRMTGDDDWRRRGCHGDDVNENANENERDGNDGNVENLENFETGDGK